METCRRTCEVGESWDHYVARHGGIRGVVERNEQERGLWRDCADGRRAFSERAPFIDEGYQKIWDDVRARRPPSVYLAITDRRRAQLEATYVAIALRLHRLGRDRPATTLDELTPDTIRFVPNDPVTALPFELIERDAGRVLRSGEIRFADPGCGNTTRVDILLD